MKKIINPWKGMEGYNCFGCAPNNEAGVKMEFYEDGDEVISADTLGDLSGRFSYEFVCNISKRVPRIYIRDGKECGELTYFD